MTEKEAVEILEREKFLHEQLSLESDIRDIDCILLQNPIDICLVRTQIDTINRKHPENIIIFNLIYPPQGRRPSVDEVPDSAQISDLQWKRTYLQAKRVGKAFNELCKEMWKATGRE